jgi:thiosulfate dehydrogenase [quinone] large subunit
MKLSNMPVFILRIAVAALFISIGLDKYNEGWLTTSEHVRSSLDKYHQESAGPQRTYLEAVAIPYAGIWSKLIVAGEILLGVSLLLGILVRGSTALGVFMVLNLHAANGNLFSLNFFSSPWAATLVAGLLLLMLARAGRWGGIDALLSKNNSKNILW